VRTASLPRFAYGALLVLTLGGMTAATGVVWIDKADAHAAARRAADLQCLAENVYYEARGEPLVGQYAVAEVTMNRVTSPLFPASVCAVVHARGAFSWTGTKDRPAPFGYEWRRARAVASTVYDNQEAPLVNGALYYHATYVSPDWAPTRSRVALIGHHLFYL
jgi:N-acetylmuramoyl-L-alanine amidase